MKKRLRLMYLVMAVLMLFALSACNRGGIEQGNIHEITDEQPGDIYAVIRFLGYEGEVVIKLFPEVAPENVARFIELAERGYYDRRNIHRVVENQLIQGGSVNFDGTDGAVQEREFVEQEFSPNARHFYGALSMAADGQGRNYSQFFIVTNKNPVDIDADIEMLQELLASSENAMNSQARSRHQKVLEVMKAIPDNIKELYLTRGGVPAYDDNSTVIGQLVSGHEIIDALNSVEVVAGNRYDDEVGTRTKPLDEIIIESITIIHIPLEVEEAEETRAPRRGAATTRPEPDGDLSEIVDMD
jgi:peptidyl-prolyl cis-trans isomerase B (cyclophilin B)